MSGDGPSSWGLRTGDVYPVLPEAQVERVREYGTVEELRAGQVLYTCGDTDFGFYLVTEGAVELYRDKSGRRSEKGVITVYRERQFTGELSLVNRQQSLVHAQVSRDGSAIRLTPAQLRQLIANEPDIARTLLQAFILRRMTYIQEGYGKVILVGPGTAASTLTIHRFLERNDYPMQHIDADDPAAAEALAEYGIPADARLPLVICKRGVHAEDPTVSEVAALLGIQERIDVTETADVTIVGAGPAGLAAAVYAASEGLRTVVIEAEAPGGQAGTSSMIENYLGFPLGVSGHDLAARAQVQARKFGARIALPRRVEELDRDGSHFVLRLDDGERIRTRTVVVATGARYRRLGLPELARFEGSGVHYAATALESAFCLGDEIVIVGGANSAGQAAVFLSQFARRVHVLVRGPELAATMSQYLLTRIEASPRIQVHVHTEITGLEGEERLESVSWKDNRTGRTESHPVSNVFLMLGAAPNTAWLNGLLETDPKGFVLVGSEVTRTDAYPDGSRPASMETSVPGIFAVGDVRSGSVKRVASAVGEGSIVISDVHRALAAARHTVAG
ncbi:FAD-dependent oxidoreductase [Streptomyces sp. NPDC090108]|uniref:FAD-dependent oxidoreductase n=1 Tax=Streptomyces sp. NPDC090108 TaxID=3365947 RepID=UPI003801EFCA